MIVTAYDGTSASRAALTWAAREACRRGSQLRIVHAINVPTLVDGTGSSGVAAEPLVDIGESLLEEGEKLARELGVPDVATELLHGTPAGAVVEQSRTAELVVVGSRGRGEFRSAALGSVAYTVTAHASSPVVVVRPDQDGVLDANHPVVVASDGSAHAQLAIAVAAGVAARAGVRLHIVSAWHLPAIRGDVSVGAWVWPDAGVRGESYEAVAKEDAERLRAQTASEHPDLQVTAEVLEGEAAPQICRAAEHAGLIVVGSRGHAGFAGLLLGSVSHRVLHDAVVPVMVAR